MSIRTSALKLANKLRALPSSTGVDIYTTSVTIRTKTWTSGRRGAEGPVTTSDVVLTPRPKVREIKQREIADSGGRYESGDVKIGPVTPSNAVGGYTPSQLTPRATASGIEYVYVLSGGITGEYKLVELVSDRALSYYLVVRRSRITP